MLQQRHDVHAIPFEDGTRTQVEGMKLQRAQFLGNRALGAGKKARADPMGNVAETQIDARRLDLIVGDRFQRLDLARPLDCIAQ